MPKIGEVFRKREIIAVFSFRFFSLEKEDLLENSLQEFQYKISFSLMPAPLSFF